MPMTPVAPPHTVPILSGFDYVTVDERRRRVYAAHNGSKALLVVNADSGAVMGQVKVGDLHGVAVDPATGHVFTGNGGDQSISEVDPVGLKEVRSVDVPGAVDAIVLDTGNGRIYADEDNGTHVYVVDSHAMKLIGTVNLPGHKPEYLAVNPRTHELYQNITDLQEVAVIDPASLKVSRTFPTPQILANHPLQFDPVHGHIIVGGKNGVLGVYEPTGAFVGKLAVAQKGIDQCDLDRTSHLFACAGSGAISVFRDNPSGPPTLVSTTPIARTAHTVGIDPKTDHVWTVWPTPAGDYVAGFKVPAK